jgi:hypothetical protein
MSELYIEVTNIHWNEGPTYRGPASFWFVVDESTYNEVEDDPIHGLALFQHIDNELKQSSKYAGVNSDRLEWNVYNHEQLKKRFKKGTEFDMIDLSSNAEVQEESPSMRLVK